MNITRRQFLKYTGASALALSATPIFDKVAMAKALEQGGDPVGILVDTTRCIGCRSCQAACKKKNNLPPDPQPLPANRTFPKALSATSFTLVEFRQVDVSGQRVSPQVKPAGSSQTADPSVAIRTVKKQCMHCLNPACASVCPVGAITKTAEGPVVYDADKCMGCRYCMAACPFNIPKFEWDSANPRIRKCNMCADLVAQGQPTACVAACPVQALQFGKRTDLVAEAQARIGKESSKYTPYIYGLGEVGGTSVLYLANVPFEQLGFKTDLPRADLPDYTWQVMEKIPGVAVGVGLLMGTISWFTHRKPAHSGEEH
ncbi:MAG: 4Fe-4S dicluster domain-containing protein [Anaerolineae bacterium]